MSAAGLAEIQKARAAGFTDEEIAQNIADEKSKAEAAGFSAADVDTYYGNPPFDDAPIKALLHENHKAATTPSADGTTQPKPITSFTEAIEAGLQMSVSGLVARGKGPDLALTEDAPRSSRIAANVASLAGDIPAMIGGFLAGGGQITGMAGAFALPTAIRKVLMDKYEKGEVRDFSDFWDRLSGVAIDTAKSWITGAATGAVGKAVGAAAIPNKVLKGAAVTSAELGTMVTVGNALEGKVPSADEFIDTAIALGFVKGSVAVAKKLRGVYSETGVTPEELARDAEKDPTIQQDLAADNIDVPRRYKDIALNKVGKSVVSEAETADKTIRQRFEDVYTRFVDDLNPIREEVKKMNTIIEEGGGKVNEQNDPYVLMRLLRGNIGRAAHFLEQGTYDFKSLKNNGESLKSILQGVEDVDTLQNYLVARRAVEKHQQGIRTGIDPATALAAVKEGKGRFEEVAKRITAFSDRVTEHLRDSGILSTEAYEAMREVNKDYVPFFRAVGEQPGLGKGSSAFNPIKEMKGSDKAILKPLESIIKNTYVYIALAERNAANAQFIKHADSTKISDLFYSKVKTPVKPIELNEQEIKGLFDAFVTEKKKAETVSKTETTRTTPGGKAEPESKGFTLVKNRVLEALRARGFAEGEAQQMIDRLMAKGGEGGTVEKLVKEIEKTELVQELNIRLPHEAATIFRAMSQPIKADEIAVFTDGKRQVYQVDPDVASAFKALDAETANMFVKLIAIPAQTLRAGAILSPDFMVRNALRDQLSAFIISKHGFFPIFDFARGFMSLIKKDEAYGDWLKSGGANAAMVSVDRQYLSQHVFKLSKETGLMERAWNVAKSPLEVLRVASELTENATRLGAFKKLDAVTKQDKQAAGFASREVTLDFARIGANMRAVNMISAFTNAQVQGLDRVVRGFNDSPVGMAAKIGGAITLPSLLLWWANKDDERWAAIPRWEKDLFWIVMTKDNVYRIPKPFELGIVFGTLPERSLEAFMADNPTAMKDLDKAMLDAFLPNLTPQIAQPIIEQFSNKSMFTGTPIVPHDAEGQLPEYQYHPYTTELSKAIGGILGAFPGMRERAITDEFTPVGLAARAVSSPALIENYVRSWTGGLGMYILQLADKGLREAKVLPDPVTPTPVLSDIPFIKAFVVRYPSASTQQISDFYEQYKLNNTYIKTIKKRAEDGDETAVKLMEENQDKLDDLSGVKESISGMSQLVRMVYKNPDIPADEKRQIIDSAYFTMIQLAEHGLEEVRLLKEAVK